jgi:uncharacterized membrane protein YadS
MIAYPPLCALLGFGPRATGIFLGATIHDVAQVVGAGYAVSDEAGNIATIVKLFRVFMLLPVVLGVGWWFSSQGGDSHKARVPIPVFAIMFLASVIINTLGILPPLLKFGLIEAFALGTADRHRLARPQHVARNDPARRAASHAGHAGLQAR